MTDMEELLRRLAEEHAGKHYDRKNPAWWTAYEAFIAGWKARTKQGDGE